MLRKVNKIIQLDHVPTFPRIYDYTIYDTIYRSNLVSYLARFNIPQLLFYAITVDSLIRIDNRIFFSTLICFIRANRYI